MHFQLDVGTENYRNAVREHLAKVMTPEFEERISSLVSSDPEISEYVRMLKRREFAQ